MTFEVVGGGDTPLSVEARSCILRACRKEMRHLQAEAYRYSTLSQRYASGLLKVTEQEMDCLGAGIVWLNNLPVK
jgi:hypothetical protein